MAKKLLILGALVLSSVLIFQSCTSLTDLAGSLAQLQRLKFKLGTVEGFSLAGISLSHKASLNDFTVQDGLKLAQLFSSKKLPVEFTLNVVAINPNDGSSGKIKTTATLSGLAARLLIDGQSTVYGDITSPIDIPGTGQETIIPLRLSLDLYEFFGSQGLDRLLQLALAIGGRNGSSARLALDIQPRVMTPFGEIKYPERLTIVDKEFR
ncbi:MAG: hypothetical protein ACUVRL_07360 [Candidatus Saccharicenans sp.]|uniref:hypothetical protein n=1 Tax=Candidatus Saccharicenans sp. TaxID=2819258 RepID=UPI0040491636